MGTPRHDDLDDDRIGRLDRARAGRPAARVRGLCRSGGLPTAIHVVHIPGRVAVECIGRRDGQAGAAVGAIAGQVLGRNTKSTVIGAVIGGVIANSPAYAYPRAYYPVAGYQPYPAYTMAPAYGCPGGYWARRPIRNQFGEVVGWSRPRFFCPAY